MTRCAKPLAFTTALLLACIHTAQAQATTEEVPFITTPDAVTVTMLRMAGAARADHVIDLGSGDGRIVITAARRFGASGLGVEIVPELVQRSTSAAHKAGVAHRVSFVEQDLFKTDLSPATVITMYLLPEFNLQLRPKLLALKPGTRVVSHDWDMGDWLPDRTETLEVPDKPVGREKLSRVHLWWVPAPLQGAWCAADGQRLELQQQYQVLRGQLLQPPGRAAPSRQDLNGRLRGTAVELMGLAVHFSGQWVSSDAGAALHMTKRGAGRGQRLDTKTRAQVWRATQAADCPAAASVKP